MSVAIVCLDFKERWEAGGPWSSVGGRALPRAGSHTCGEFPRGTARSPDPPQVSAFVCLWLCDLQVITGDKGLQNSGVLVGLCCAAGQEVEEQQPGASQLSCVALFRT